MVVGASAGGVEALRNLVETLPHELRAAVFVVLHVPPTDTSVLPDILKRAGPLPAKQASDREPSCHVGHSYSAASVLTQQADDLERSLWAPVRALIPLLAPDNEPRGAIMLMETR